MIYKFKDESIKKYDQKPSGNETKFDLRWIEKYQKFYKKYRNLVTKELIVNGGNYGLVEITYSRLTPKTSRYIFRKDMQNINDIPQRDTKIFKVNNNLYLSVTYQLKIEEISNFVGQIHELLKLLDFDLTEKKWLLLSSKHKSLFSKIINIEKIAKPTIGKIANFVYARLYSVGTFKEIINLLKSYDINFEKEEIIDHERLIFFLSPKNANLISNNLSWLVSDVILPKPFQVDLSKEIKLEEEITIRSNGDEFVVGVIDSGFEPTSPLYSFVESYHDEREDKVAHNYSHGSSVASLIIANDEINPTSPDGLGNFRVRHFELLEPKNGKIEVNWAYLYRKITNIVRNNKDIKVWNISFGGTRIENFKISSHGLLLDKMASQHDCIFIIASGNERKNYNENNSLCSPADSINNISVGSISKNGKKISRAYYSSLGYALQSIKPDVSDFGGKFLKNGDEARVHNGRYLTPNSGTSFAAPKITRLVASLIRTGMSPQEAKAKLISMVTKEKPKNASSRFGYLDDYKERFEISQAIPVSRKDLIIVGLDIPNEVEKIIITTSYLARPIPKLGHESAISEINTTLVKYRIENKKLKDGTKRKYAISQSLSTSVSDIKQANFIKEETIRFNLGKYSTTKKHIYNWQNLKNKLQSKEIGIKIQRIDLHDVEKSEDIYAYINIDFQGEKLTKEIMNSIIQIEQEIYIPDIEVK